MTAAQMLKIIEGSKPKYNDRYKYALENALKLLLNRKAFSYNKDDDAQYKNYRAKAIREGKIAMEDTLGQAASLSGGLSNSYAVSAAQQQYNNNLNQLQNIIPQLYAKALERYKLEGEKLQGNVNNYLTLQNNDIKAFEKQLSAWQKDRSYYLSKAKQEAAEAEKRAKYSRGGGTTKQKRKARFRDKLFSLLERQRLKR
ncbi:MAG: hypothetical protein GYA87_02830 [Christensenellaceae bacterium]|nr:hypothetical protein [Christensenellaceae bacterium]